MLNYLSVANIDTPVNKPSTHSGAITRAVSGRPHGHPHGPRHLLRRTAAAAENGTSHGCGERRRQGRHDHQRHPRHRDARADGPQRSLTLRRSPTPISRTPPSRKVGSVRLEQTDRDRRSTRARAAHELCRRTRLGLYIANGDAGRLQRDRRGRCRTRSRACRLPRHELASPRGGHASLGSRHHRRGHVEAGLGFAIDWDKGEFLGRDALLAENAPARATDPVPDRRPRPAHVSRRADLLRRHRRREHVIVDVVCDQDRCCAMGYVRHPDGESITAAWQTRRRGRSTSVAGWFRCRHRSVPGTTHGMAPSSPWNCGIHGGERRRLQIVRSAPR